MFLKQNSEVALELRLKLLLRAGFCTQLLSMGKITTYSRVACGCKEGRTILHTRCLRPLGMRNVCTELSGAGRLMMTWAYISCATVLSADVDSL